MLGLFKRGFLGRGARPSLDAVRFDTTGYALQGEPHPGKVRVWYTPEGDGFGMHFLPVPPNLPANAASADEFAAFYRTLLVGSGGKLVECRVEVAGGCPAVRTVVSVPQQTTGLTYVGSLTVPFRDFSFVLKCQSAEGSPTGLKEALLLDRSLGANEPMQVEGGQFHILGWDPDDPKHDAEFPDHPVARVRRVLDHVAGSLEIATAVRKLPGFAIRA